nr:MAG TPA: DNA-packaging protein [Bacteriophage sp.]
MNDNTLKIEQGVEVYENKISEYLDQYILEKNILDMSKEPQSKWNAALIYIYKALFKNNKESLKGPDKDTYNDRLMNDICDIYISLCYEYDKEISINGFCFLTGINTDTVYTWGSGERRLGSSCSEIYKKLIKNNEESLSDKLISGGLNPMKVLPALNRRHNWNMPGTSRQGGEEQRSIEEIQQRYKVPELSENTAQLKPPDADF